MNRNRDSVTSLVSAFGRAYHSEFDSPKIFDDYMAKALISEQEFSQIRENMIRNIHVFNQDIAQTFHDDPERILQWITQVQLSPIALSRAAYCEQVLLNELKLGVRQYVILGAGLDTFCYRRPELAGHVEVFEVDLPSAQAFKKRRLADAGLDIPENLHFAAMDFTGRFSGDSLVKEGFLNRKTFFSFLGVSYYLTKEEIKGLMQNLFALVPPGSSVVFDYADEKLFHVQGLSGRVAHMVKLAAAAGEPMKSCFSAHEIASLLEEAGLLICEHLTPAAINDRFFRDRTDDLTAFETIHYIHAVKK